MTMTTFLHVQLAGKILIVNRAQLMKITTIALKKVVKLM